MELERLQSLPDSIHSQAMVSGDPSMSMVEIVRDRGDGDASILNTSIGISGSFPLVLGSAKLGAVPNCCGMPNMVVAFTIDGTETKDVVSELMCDVDESTVGMVPTSDTTPLAMPLEVVASSELVSDQLQWVASPMHGELSIEVGYFN